MGKIKQKRESLVVIHTIPGRVRFHFKSNETEIPDLDIFLAISGVKEVTFNKITKSLLIIYDRKKLNLGKLISKIKVSMPALEISKGQLQKNDNPSEIFLNNNLLSDIVYKFANNANYKVNQKMKGKADLTSLIPSGLVLFGIEELIRNPVMPRWYDMWWYAYNIFMQNYPNRLQNSSITLSKGGVVE